MHMKLIRFHQPVLTQWPDLGGFADLRNEIDRLFDAPFSGLTDAPRFTTGWSPAFDVYENQDNFTVVAELPGVKKEDLAISLHEGRLSISGERKREEKSENTEVYRSERVFGRFQRTFTLPTAVTADKVTAKFTDGVLTVTLPKAEEAKPKQIDVTVN
jgi:HSP20 family protein